MSTLYLIPLSSFTCACQVKPLFRGYLLLNNIPTGARWSQLPATAKKAWVHPSIHTHSISPYRIPYRTVSLLSQEILTASYHHAKENNLFMSSKAGIFNLDKNRHLMPSTIDHSTPFVWRIGLWAILYNKNISCSRTYGALLDPDFFPPYII